MLNQTSTNLRTLTLLRITKKLIENTDTAAICRLEKYISSGRVETVKIIRKEIPKPKSKEEIKNDIKKEVKEKLNYIPSVKVKEELVFVVPDNAKSPLVKNNNSRQVQNIPPQSSIFKRPANPLKSMANSPDDLPEYLRYLKPVKNEFSVGIDLGKLNPFLSDPNVKSIETDGENEKVYVNGLMGKKPTNLVLTREEIEEIIDKFSAQAKIPKTEGFFKVVSGNLILNAMVSKAISSSFIIKKM